MNEFMVQAIQALLIPVLSPLIVGITRKMKARLQGRRGAPVIQPYRDLWKLLHKEELVSKDASWVFLSAPYLLLTVTVVIGAGIPVVWRGAALLPCGDIIVVVYLLALYTFALALAGMDTGSPFGGFGSSREMTVSALTEGGLLFSLFAVSLIARKTGLSEIASQIASMPFASSAPIIIAAIAFCISLLAENGRFPFDNPATHLELTMIHEAMLLEYSARHLALMEWAAALKLFNYACIGFALFIPWGLAAEGAGPVGLVASIPVLGLKLLVAGAALALLETMSAKLRVFRASEFLATAFLLAVLGVLVHLLLGA